MNSSKDNFSLNSIQNFYVSAFVITNSSKICWEIITLEPYHQKLNYTFLRRVSCTFQSSSNWKTKFLNQRGKYVSKKVSSTLGPLSAYYWTICLVLGILIMFASGNLTWFAPSHLWTKVKYILMTANAKMVNSST